MELNDDQFERIIGMLAENRAAVSELRQEMKVEFESIRREITVGSRISSEAFVAIQEDLTQVQSMQRSHDQALRGLTQLCKSTFDVAESAMKRVIEESNRVEDDDAEKSHGAPQ